MKREETLQGRPRSIVDVYAFLYTGIYWYIRLVASITKDKGKYEIEKGDSDAREAPSIEAPEFRLRFVTLESERNKLVDRTRFNERC